MAFMISDASFINLLTCLLTCLYLIWCQNITLLGYHRILITPLYHGQCPRESDPAAAVVRDIVAKEMSTVPLMTERCKHFTSDNDFNRLVCHSLYGLASTRSASIYTTLPPSCLSQYVRLYAELSMGWVDPRVGLGWQWVENFLGWVWVDDMDP